MNVGHSTVPLSDDRRVSASFHIFTVNLSHRRTAQWPQPSKRDAFRPGFQPLGPLTDYHRPIRSPSCYLPTSSDRGKLSFLLEDEPIFFSFFFEYSPWLEKRVDGNRLRRALFADPGRYDDGHPVSNDRRAPLFHPPITILLTWLAPLRPLVAVAPLPPL